MCVLPWRWAQFTDMCVFSHVVCRRLDGLGGMSYIWWDTLAPVTSLNSLNTHMPYWWNVWYCFIGICKSGIIILGYFGRAECLTAIVSVCQECNGSVRVCYHAERLELQCYTVMLHSAIVLQLARYAKKHLLAIRSDWVTLRCSCCCCVFMGRRYLVKVRESERRL